MKGGTMGSVEFDPDLAMAFVEALARDAARYDFEQIQRADYERFNRLITECDELCDETKAKSPRGDLCAVLKRPTERTLN